MHKYKLLFFTVFIISSQISTADESYASISELNSDTSALIEELYKFVNTKEFLDSGFGAGNPTAHDWMSKAKRSCNKMRNTSIDIRAEANKKVVEEDLIYAVYEPCTVLGSAYGFLNPEQNKNDIRTLELLKDLN